MENMQTTMTNAHTANRTGHVSGSTAHSTHNANKVALHELDIDHIRDDNLRKYFTTLVRVTEKIRKLQNVEKTLKGELTKVYTSDARLKNSQIMIGDNSVRYYTYVRQSPLNYTYIAKVLDRYFGQFKGSSSYGHLYDVRQREIGKIIELLKGGRTGTPSFGIGVRLDGHKKSK